MSASITPFLMFTGRAEEAMRFYVSLFADGRIESVERYGPEEPEREGTVVLARFVIAGQRVLCIDSPAVHPFGFTPAVSLFVELDAVEEVDRLFAALSEGGEVMMPLDAYPFSRRYAWLSDRFGVSWQLSAR